MQRIGAIVLAAGKGTRMKSETPKVFHKVLDKYMLQWVIDALCGVPIEQICVVVNKFILDYEDFLEQNSKLSLCTQNNQRGTADAVASAYCAISGAKKPHYASSELLRGEPLQGCEYVLICAGDTPALNPKTIREFISECLKQGRKIGVLGMTPQDPTGYGRLVCAEDGALIKVVEHKDATSKEREIGVCNSGVMFVHVPLLFELLDSIEPTNVQKEYYLTSCFEEARKLNEAVFVFIANDYEEFCGVNDQEQLKAMESILRRRNA